MFTLMLINRDHASKCSISTIHQYLIPCENIANINNHLTSILVSIHIRTMKSVFFFALFFAIVYIAAARKKHFGESTGWSNNLVHHKGRRSAVEQECPDPNIVPNPCFTCKDANSDCGTGKKCFKSLNRWCCREFLEIPKEAIINPLCAGARHLTSACEICKSDADCTALDTCCNIGKKETCCYGPVICGKREMTAEECIPCGENYTCPNGKQCCQTLNERVCCQYAQPYVNPVCEELDPNITNCIKPCEDDDDCEDGPCCTVGDTACCVYPPVRDCPFKHAAPNPCFTCKRDSDCKKGKSCCKGGGKQCCLHL